MKKIAIISPDDLSTIIFAKTMSQMLRSSREIELTTVGSVGRFKEELRTVHSRHIDLPMYRFIHPAADLAYFRGLYRLFRKERFDAVLTFTTKPNTYGAIAASLAGVPQVTLAVRGLGRAFDPPSSFRQQVLHQCVKRLYRRACRAASLVWFTNRHDRSHFIDRRIVSKGKTFLTRNAINVDDFSMASVSSDAVTKLRNELRLRDGERVVIMVARLVWSKGVAEFCEAASLVAKRRPGVRFVLVAPPETGSRDAVPQSFVQAAARRGAFTWLGFRKDHFLHSSV